MTGNRYSPRKRWVLMAAAALGAVVLAALVLLKMTPGVYRRTAAIGPDPAPAARFDEHVINQVGNVLLDKSGGTRLDLEVTEAMVNARIARFLADEERDGKAVPQVLRQARVAFEPDRLVLATRLGEGVASVVVTQSLRLAAEPDGRLRVEPAGTRAGLLPLPATALDYVRQSAAGELARRHGETGDEGTVDLWRVILEGLDGKPVALGKGRKRILVEGIQIERGVLRVQGRRSDAAARSAPDGTGGAGG